MRYLTVTVRQKNKEWKSYFKAESVSFSFGTITINFANGERKSIDNVEELSVL